MSEQTFRGVSSHKDGGWTVTIGVESKSLYLGYFRSFEDARRARLAAEMKYFGLVFDRREVEIDGDVARLPLHGQRGRRGLIRHDLVGTGWRWRLVRRRRRVGELGQRVEFVIGQRLVLQQRLRGRDMAGNKKPRKGYRPSWNAGALKLRTEPWKVDAVFRPLERILAEIERDGSVTSTTAGVPIFRDANDGCWYETAPAIEGVVAAYEIHATRQGRQLPLEPLKMLVRKLRYAMPLQEADVTAARAALDALRRETLDMRADYARDLVRTTQIRIEFDAKEAA